VRHLDFNRRALLSFNLEAALDELAGNKTRMEERRKRRVVKERQPREQNGSVRATQGRIGTSANGLSVSSRVSPGRGMARMANARS
jgi:hypothetical protein